MAQHPHSSWMIALAGTVALAAATCTQSYDDFAFDGATTPTGTGTAAAGGTAPGGSGGQTTTGGSGGQTTTGGSGGQTTTGGSGGGGTGGTGGQPPTYEVACDQTPCDVTSGGYCCLPHEPQNSPSCEPSGNGCDEQDYTTVTCDGPEDCPAQLCCGTRQSLTYITLECADSCDGFSQNIVCDPNGPDQCGPWDDCLQSGYLPDGYFVCR